MPKPVKPSYGMPLASLLSQIGGGGGTTQLPASGSTPPLMQIARSFATRLNVVHWPSTAWRLIRSVPFWLLTQPQFKPWLLEPTFVISIQ